MCPLWRDDQILTIIPGRSKKGAEKVIAALLNARRRLELLIAKVESLQKAFLEDRGTSAMRIELAKYEGQVPAAQEKVKALEVIVGKASSEELRRSRGSKFIDRRIEARILKTRLRARLIQRKMEMTRIEHPLRTQANGM